MRRSAPGMTNKALATKRLQLARGLLNMSCRKQLAATIRRNSHSMSTSLPSSALEIHVHSTDGSCARFAQDAEAGAKTLQTLQPARFFSQSALLLQSAQTLTMMPPSAVARVDFVGSPAQFAELGAVQSGWKEVDEATWNAHCSAPDAAPDATAGATAPTLIAICLQGGARVFIEARMETPSVLQQRQSLQNLFNAPAQLFARPGGGASLLNPAAIVEVVFCPAPEAPTTAWFVQPLKN